MASSKQPSRGEEGSQCPSITISTTVPISTGQPLWHSSNLKDECPPVLKFSKEAWQEIMNRRVLLAIATGKVNTLEFEDGRRLLVCPIPDSGYSTKTGSATGFTSPSNSVSPSWNTTHPPIPRRYQMRVKRIKPELKTESGNPKQSKYDVFGNAEGEAFLVEGLARCPENTARIGAILQNESQDGSVSYHAIPWPLTEKFLNKHHCAVDTASSQMIANAMDKYHLGALHLPAHTIVGEIIRSWRGKRPSRMGAGVNETGVGTGESDEVPEVEVNFAEPITELYRQLENKGLFNDLYSLMTSTAETPLQTEVVNTNDSGISVAPAAAAEEEEEEEEGEVVMSDATAGGSIDVQTEDTVGIGNLSEGERKRIRDEMNISRLV